MSKAGASSEDGAPTAGLQRLGFIDRFLLWLQCSPQRRCFEQFSDHLLKDVGFAQAETKIDTQNQPWHG